MGGKRLNPLMDPTREVAVADREKLERNSAGYRFSGNKKGGKVFQGAGFYGGRKKHASSRRRPAEPALFVLAGFDQFADDLFAQAEPALFVLAGFDQFADDLFAQAEPDGVLEAGPAQAEPDLLVAPAQAAPLGL